MDKQAERFGQPVAALLGSIEAQIQLGLPSIGGKDSMSGTFEELTVPPTLVAFGSQQQIAVRCFLQSSRMLVKTSTTSQVKLLLQRLILT